ncbi:MAG: MFS transporter [Prevotella sp.]|jgi:FHS family L-fucose permease-like MFS transporter|nr:MFS transporter [Prevotella sp.]
MNQHEKQISYLGPFITLVFLFFVVGFLTTANGQFQGPLKTAFLQYAGDLKNTFATLITFSWFLAYPLTGRAGSSWVTKYGYKGTLVRGLFIMILGLFIFFLSSWFTLQFPDAKVQIASATIPSGFFIFLAGSFVVGASATILQVVINPYLVACTVKGTQAIQRLAIGGSSNSIGTTIAPFFVTGIVFGGLSMEEVQVSQLMLPFAALGIVMLTVALVVMKLSLPDIEGTKAEAGEKLEKSIWSFRHLTLGVIAIFFYVGVEVAIGANINLYAIEQETLNAPFTFFGHSSLTLFGINFAIPAFMATLYWGGMLIGRLVGSSLSKVPPRVQLVITTVSATVLTILAIIMNNPWMLVAAGLFHSIMWGAIFTLSISKLGKYTSVASGVFMIGVVGGAILPLLQGMLADVISGWRWTWFIVVFGELFMLYYALAGSRVRQSA